jgi:hypothetical protein
VTTSGNALHAMAAHASPFHEHGQRQRLEQERNKTGTCPDLAREDNKNVTK